MDMERFYSPELLATMKDAIVAELNEKDGEKKNDPVHPTHYMLPEGLQVIDVEMAMYGKEAVKSHCLCTAIEYLLRCKQKNGDQDVEKACWWVQKYLELAKEDE